MMRVRDELLPGPTTERTEAGTAGAPNRLGSERVPVRVYEPDGAEPWATLVWAHGGSFVRGDLDWPEADWVSRRSAEAGMRVYSVDYALASDTVKAPAPANDVAAVLRKVLTLHEGPVLIGGASAGGHLATAATIDIRSDPADPAGAAAGRRPEALLLVYPTLHRVQREDRALAAATAGLPEARRFSAARIAEMYEFYLGGAAGDGQVAEEGGAGVTPAPVGELPAQRLAGLPPTVIVNADADDLRASGEQFAEQLREAGVQVSETVQPGTVHGYMNRPEESAESLRDAHATIDLLVTGARAILAPADDS